MNAQLLRDALVKEVTALFETRRFPSSHGPVAPRVYKQFTPIQDSGALDDILPYVIVRVNGGAVKAPAEPHLVSVTFLCGAFDEAKENKGFDAVEEMIQDILFHFTQQPLFGGGFFRFVYPAEWANQEEESYPYFFGALTCSFQITPPIYTKGSELT